MTTKWKLPTQGLWQSSKTGISTRCRLSPPEYSGSGRRRKEHSQSLVIEKWFRVRGTQIFFSKYLEDVCLVIERGKWRCPIMNSYRKKHSMIGRVPCVVLYWCKDITSLFSFNWPIELCERFAQFLDGTTLPECDFYVTIQQNNVTDCFDEISTFERNNIISTMSLMSVIVVLIVTGVILWLVNTYIPMDRKIKSILNAVVVIVLVLWLLQAFGILNSFNDIKIK